MAVLRGTSQPRSTSWKKLSSARSAANWTGAHGRGPAKRKTVQQVVRGAAKVGRNDPCPCGSGKKYKKCHGA